MLKFTVSLINDNIDPLKAVDLFGKVESVPNKYDINENVCSLQSLLYDSGLSGDIFESLESVGKYLDYFEKLIAETNKYEGINLVFGCPKIRNTHDVDLCLYFFKSIDDMCTTTKFSIENCNKDYGTYRWNTISDIYRFINMNDFKHIGINLDLGSFLKNGESFENIKKCKDKINHVHISSYGLKTIKSLPLIGIHELLDVLEDIDYKGYVSLESLEDDLDYYLNIISLHNSEDSIKL